MKLNGINCSFRNYFIAFAALLLVHNRAIAQQNNHFTNYTVANGLPQSSIDDIAQDADGFLWIGTAGGLCRFDGYTFKSYRPKAQDPTSIIEEKGFRFYLDKRGQFWIITHNGISLYNAEKDNFINLLRFETPLVINRLSAFFGEDGQYLYAGLCPYGIIRVNKISHSINRINIKGIDSLKNNSSWYKGFIEKGKLWVLGNNNFAIYNIKSGTSARLNIPIKSLINMNSEQALGIAMDDKSLVVINKKDLSTHVYPFFNGNNSANLNVIYRLSDSIAIAGSTSAGIYYFNTLKGKIINNIFDAGGEKRHPLSAYCFYNDRSGNLWIGTQTNGVYQLRYPFKKFKLYRSSSGLNDISSLYADSLNLYAGCKANGIDVYSRSNGFIKNINLNKQLPAVINTGIITRSVKTNSLLLVAYNSVNGGHMLPLTLETSNNKLQLLKANVQKLYTDNWGQGNFRTFAIKNKDGGLITNVGENLLWVKPGKKPDHAAGLMHRFPGEMLSCGFWDSSGNLWIGTFSGLHLFNGVQWTPISLPKQTEIKTISQDNGGNLWLGTNHGIYILNRNLKVIKFYTEENGLINDHIYAILKDDDGNMWFSHNKGLTVFYWKKHHFRHFGFDDGLQSQEFNANAYFKATDDELFFGGINGTTAFMPREITENLNSPGAAITSILLFDQPYKNSTAYQHIHSLLLPYYDNSLSFEFTTTEYTDPQKNTFAYMVEGIDKKWTYTGNRRFARYAGIPPGHYTFKIKAANNDGIWGKPDVLAFVIVPPFWKRTWFVAIEALLCVSVIALVIYLFQRNEFKKKLRVYEVERMVQTERERISRDLHDNIGTQLSLISKNVKEITDPLNTITGAEKNKRLAHVQQSSVEVIDVLRETIWALSKTEISLEEFADNLKVFIQNQLAPYPGLRINYSEADANSLLILSPSAALNLFRIFQEAITNIVKYAGASTINISLLAADTGYEISITDDGVGFDKRISEKPGHFGLENMKFRATEIGAKFSIDTVITKGTTILLIKN